MKTLITQSLLSSWLYTFNCAEGYEEEAMADFLRTLRREPGEQSEAMLNGILFEKGVYALAKDPNDITVFPNWKRVSLQIAQIIRGSQIQLRASRDITVDGNEYLLYCVCDAVKAGIIYDIKFTSKGMGSADLAGKYLESPQHPAYMFCLPDARRFVYLVSDGDCLYTEVYERKDVPDIATIIRNFRNDLRFKGLEDIYLEHWEAK